MKLRKTTMAIVAIGASCAAGALSADEQLPVRHCTWCHGASAQGYANAPRIAGQTHQYLESSLWSFKTHIRDNPNSKAFMWGAAGNLTRQTAHDFALYFSQLAPEPANDGDGALAVAGKAIYDEGIPQSNIVSCIVCHGPNAQGFEGIPRLGGLRYSYLKQRLEQWSEGFHASAEPMPRIARRLSANEIEALASYLSFVK